jgi:hypothetical protein
MSWQTLRSHITQYPRWTSNAISNPLPSNFALKFLLYIRSIINSSYLFILCFGKKARWDDLLQVAIGLTFVAPCSSRIAVLAINYPFGWLSWKSAALTYERSMISSPTSVWRQVQSRHEPADCDSNELSCLWVITVGPPIFSSIKLDTCLGFVRVLSGH